jgi:hypothetical protein
VQGERSVGLSPFKGKVRSDNAIDAPNYQALGDLIPAGRDHSLSRQKSAASPRFFVFPDEFALLKALICLAWGQAQRVAFCAAN